MTNEEKQLLLNNLCARARYGVKCSVSAAKPPKTIVGIIPNSELVFVDKATIFGPTEEGYNIELVKPYLRSMSSMTDKEKDELRDIIYFGYPSDDYDEYGHRGVEIAYVEHDDWTKIKFDFDDFCSLENWLNIHHFDYRGLIEKGLALEAPEGMYKNMEE